MPHSTITAYEDKYPKIESEVFVASGAHLIGNVTIKNESSIWFNTVIRADVQDIYIGEQSNIQDNTVIHVTYKGHPSIIEDQVTVGHGAILHACTVKSLSLIGMGATILDGAVINEQSMVAAGSVVPPGKSYPAKSLIMGSPAKAVRTLSEKELKFLEHSAKHYYELSKNYRHASKELG